MSHPLGTYSFLPWLRRGLANQIASADHDASVITRAKIDITLDLTGKKVDGSGDVSASVEREVALFGPGDIQGIDRRAIVRVEPRDWITNFEPNFLPHVEFYDEDFPWRYTPAAPDLAKGRLRPWIMLVVLTENEFKDGADIRDKPLPFIDVPDTNVFPAAEGLWAWAHVHVNRTLAGSDTEFTSNDMNAVLPRLQSVLNENPDLACSRIVCPRKLEEKQAYHAFLVPVFETGRLAGLGLDPAKSPHATFSAWKAYTSGTKEAATSYPYYYRWYFRTGTQGDFESLVRLLEPKPVDNRVGTRNMDVLKPGSNVRGLQDTPDLKGILRLGGALRVPEANFKGKDRDAWLLYENWDAAFPREIQTDLATLINLADDYAEHVAEDANSVANIANPEKPTENDPDPLITPPLYGMWHARTKRLLKKRDGTPETHTDNWVHELNLDPRYRVAAGFGTRVVQDQQEKFMDAAWEQIGKVLEANKRIRIGQFARETSRIWYDRHLKPLAAVSHQKTLLMVAPLNKRVMASPTTVHQRLLDSPVQPAMTSAALRRIMRPRARLVQSLAFDKEKPLDALLARVNDGKISAASPKETPPGVVTVNEVGEATAPTTTPFGPEMIEALRKRPWLRWLPWILALLFAILLFFVVGPWLALLFAAVLFAIAFAVARPLGETLDALRGSDSLLEDSQTPDSIDALPSHPGFVLTEPGDDPVGRPGGGDDSGEAKKFKVALEEAYVLIQASAEAATVPPKRPLDLGTLVEEMVDKIDPGKTIPKRVLGGIRLPKRVRDEVGEEEQLVQAMAYPVIDAPMYVPLKELSAELFLPNINLIEQNSITLVETNQAFIEAYMVGLNHEFGRELLWREYPCDQRGSYFRQFWDVSTFFNTENLDDEALKEKLRDIPRLDRWLKSSHLGDHDHRQPPGSPPVNEVVLVIRGELLKRYPTAVIYAHRACWQRKDDGSAADKAKFPCDRSGGIDNKKERRLVQLTPAEEAKPPRTKVRTPLYEAKVDPDIYFFGFDLKVEDARGGTGANETDDPGWFFVIKERPGEPRFGLDIDKQNDLNVWNDLSWGDVQPGAAGSHIEIDDATPSKTLVLPAGDEEEKLEQYEDDKNIAWNKDMSSADLAYVLFQAPVLVAVHAAEMLPK